MGSITREKGVLKLVHPGRYIEIHTQPITAAEVMRRNPRHSITRPDVFEFPYIVVKAEAVLVPGKVFFIVPNRTIYDLLKAKGCCSQPWKNHVNNQHHHTQTSSIKSTAGSTPKHQFRNMSLDELSPKEQDCENKHKQQSPAEFSPQVFAKYKRSPSKFKHHLLEDLTTEIRLTDAKEKHQRRKKISAKLPKTEIPDPVSECSTSKHVTMLKPCLRKPDSYRKFLHLRVTFDLSINDAEQQRRLSACPAEFAAYPNL
jgi:hypothetical protein